jgi:hypothetical protein
VYYVDRNHPNGPELHWITDNAIVLITNALRGDGLNVCTHIPARPGQLKRYPTGDNPSFYACEQIFPDNDWKIPGWLLNKAQEHQRMGLNYRESIKESYQLGDLLQDRQEMAWDYVTYRGNKKLLNLINSDPEAERQIKDAVFDAVEREVPDVTDDDDDFTKSSRVGMEAAMQEYSRICEMGLAAESFMDTVKSGWKKIKNAFKDRPEVKLVGDKGQKVVGYVHDYDKKRGTCSVIAKKEVDENVAAIAGAVAGATAASRRRGDYEDDYEPKKGHVQQFKRGDKATLVGSDIGDNIPVTILDYEKCADLDIYTVKLEA